jgi:hypothetical protein
VAKPNCSKCGAIKEGSYVKESWCSKCTGEKRKARIAQRRADSGLPVWGSGRDPKCKICRAVKEEPYLDGSYCGSCKLAKMKESYELKVTTLGLPRQRKGRNPICKCGATKENSDTGFCRLCTNEKKRLLREKNKQDPAWVEFDTKRNIARFAENALESVKQACRRETHKAIRQGILKYLPCEVCGLDDASVQAHHDDYTKPLDIRWLCSWHHAEHHKNQKK